jgi:uncharacterized cupin superfamily protein
MHGLQGGIEPYPFDEFCHVPNGAVTVTDKSGCSETYRTGHPFFMPRGSQSIWYMTETLREYFVIYSGD